LKTDSLFWLREFFAEHNQKDRYSADMLILDKIMNIRGIRHKLLLLLLELGRSSHPNEFVALLRERDGIIEEMNILPGTVAGEDSASLLYDMMPLDTHLAGSAHSHPNGMLHPSQADVNFFPRTGRYHLIIGYPYRESDWQCFTADGNPHSIEVIG
jgi:proteasome lid subunit RPN8/RPN11